MNQAQVVNIGGERRSRPDRIRDGNLPDDERTIDRWFDTSAFVALNPTPGAVGFVPNRIYGNSGVGVVRGPNYVNLDFNVAKDFAITERVAAQFRGEFFNALNHANFGVPGVTITARLTGGGPGCPSVRPRKPGHTDDTKHFLCVERLREIVVRAGIEYVPPESGIARMAADDQTRRTRKRIEVAQKVSPRLAIGKRRITDHDSDPLAPQDRTCVLQVVAEPKFPS
jgi:hypothetical protein